MELALKLDELDDNLQKVVKLFSHLEGRSVSVEEILVPSIVPELAPLQGISQQSARITVQRAQLCLKALATHVDGHPLAATQATVVVSWEDDVVVTSVSGSSLVGQKCRRLNGGLVSRWGVLLCRQ
jgi:hypothetical protein